MKWGDGGGFSVHSCIKCCGFSDKLQYGHSVSFLWISFLKNYNTSKLTYVHGSQFTLLLKGWISYPKSRQCSGLYTLWWFVCVCVCACVCVSVSVSASVRHFCHRTRAHLNVSQEFRFPARKVCVETILGPIRQPIQRTPVVMLSNCDRRTRGDLPPAPVRFHDLYSQTGYKSSYCYHVCSLSEECSVNSWQICCCHLLWLLRLVARYILHFTSSSFNLTKYNNWFVYFSIISGMK
jgi:hypothetical protein